MTSSAALTASCPACGAEVACIAVVQRAELLRREGNIMVNFEAAVVPHDCPDPREDRAPRWTCPACGDHRPHRHLADGGLIALRGWQVGS